MTDSSARTASRKPQAASLLTAVHVTHEAVRKIGGIGTVLEGLITSTPYQQAVGRTLLVGPIFDHQGAAAGLGAPGGTVLFSSRDHVDNGGWQPRFEPICRKYGVDIIYGKRTLTDAWRERSAEVEVLLIDVATMDLRPVNAFKFQLHETFDVHSDRYEYIWDFEQYVRLALPAFDAVQMLRGDAQDGQVLVISHEYMGVPTALRALLAADPHFTTVFHAHEVASVRPLVEDRPGHDTMFYNVLDRAASEGLFLPDLFGAQDKYFKHDLVSAAHHCDGLFAVGDYVRRELRFLSPTFAARDIDVVPNGVPATECSLEEHQRSRDLLLTYAETLLEWRPTYVFSHVARLVMSKAFWRDVHVVRRMDAKLAAQGQSAVFFLLSTEGAERSEGDVNRMEAEYGWPWHHRVGYPDLTGAEIATDRFLQDFNRGSRAVKIVFVNQFGWRQERCGRRMPADMTFVDLRRGADVEFGQSLYEPFGISQFEPLTYGAICVPTNICGCVPFAREQAGNRMAAPLVVADYVSPAASVKDAHAALSIGRAEADRVLSIGSEAVAQSLLKLLPAQQADRAAYLRHGHELAERMSWDVVAEEFFLPAARRAQQHAAARPQGKPFSV